jgi:hypothetical protein
VDYFELRATFRGPKHVFQNLDTSEEHKWITSITIPHFELRRTDRPVKSYDFDVAFDPPFECKNLSTVMYACISLCVTGDEFGEFWTCSIIGEGTTSSKLQQELDSKLWHMWQTYKNDKYSARNLFLILQLAKVCDTISDRYRLVLDQLKETINLKVGAIVPISHYIKLNQVLYRQASVFTSPL